MSGRRASPVVLMLLIGLMLTGLGLLVVPQSAEAQCSGDQQSTCCACHAEAHPVANQGEWHVEHVRRDCCWYCHGGNTQATDKDEAHVGVVRQPLDDAYLSCHSCHPDDYRERAAKFAVVLKVTPGSSEPMTQSVVLVTRSEALPAVPLAAPSATADQTGLLTLVAMVGAALAALFLGWGMRVRRTAH